MEYMNKKITMIKANNEGRNLVLKGINSICDPIAVTLGPKQGVVAVERNWGAPVVHTNSAIILQGIHVKDPFEDMGVSLVKQTCKMQNELVGNGASTSIVILGKLCNLIQKLIASGRDPIAIKTSLHSLCKKIAEAIRNQSTPYDTNNAPQLIKMLSDNESSVYTPIHTAFKMANYVGWINVEAGSGFTHQATFEKGIKINNGHMFSNLTTEQDLQTQLTSVKIAIVDQKLKSAHELLPLLKWAAESREVVLLLTQDMDSNMLSTIMVNNMRNIFKVIPVKLPGFGSRRETCAKNLAIVTNSTLVNQHNMYLLSEFTPTMLGHADRVLVSKDSTILTGTAGTKEEITKRINILQDELKSTKSTYERKQLEKDIAQLSGGMVTITVGGASEMEISHNKKIFEDIITIVKSILKYGYVPGGGISFVNALNNVEKQLNESEKIGWTVMTQACLAPFLCIMNNAGLNGLYLLESLKDRKDLSYGIDAIDGKVKNLVLQGIITSPEIDARALETACISAELFALADVFIAHKEPSKGGNVNEQSMMPTMPPYI